MKISTDSVLLGSWVHAGKTIPKSIKTILDVGAGSGVVALMLAQRSSARIDAIDISAKAYDQAQDNFLTSKWASRLNCYHSSLQNFSPGIQYDIIVSNPPYFHCPLTHKEKEGSQAKYTHQLSFCDLAEGVTRLLSPNGKFFVVLPIHEGSCFTNEAEKKKLYLSDFIWVKTATHKKIPKRVLMQFEFSRKEFSAENLLVIQNQGAYTDEYKQLTKDYYIGF